MQKLKTLIAAVALVAIVALVLGVASAQIGATQNATPTTASTPNNGFWGWVGNCWRYWTGQPTGTPYVEPPLTPIQPYNTAAPHPATPYPAQDGYAYGSGRCMVRFW